MHVLAKQSIRSILARSQLLEGAVSSELLPISGPKEPLLP